MVIFLHGPDTFRVHERLHVLREGFIQKYDQAAISLVSFMGQELTVEQLRSAVLTQSLFSSKRCCVIRDVFHTTATVAAAIVESIAHIPDDTILICTTEQLPKATSPLQERLLKSDRVEEYPLLNQGQLLRWVQQRLQTAGVQIDPAALTFVVQALGPDLWALHNVTQQLAHYTTKASLADVQVFVESPLDDNIFHFTDALAERDTVLALRLLHEQLAAGTTALYLVTMIARQIDILIQVKETAGQKTDLHPYVVKKALHHAQRFSMERLRQIYTDLLAIDITLKSGMRHVPLILDRFVLACTT